MCTGIGVAYRSRGSSECDKKRSLTPFSPSSVIVRVSVCVRVAVAHETHEWPPRTSEYVKAHRRFFVQTMYDVNMLYRSLELCRQMHGRLGHR
ncbi:uncharacterized protein LOC112692426 isoform X2 [Sipha flava]|uniref:Uncharacterized protein LOC112692426 isoform X2 n=1 Tax=Sipha flava TaxID=143950 RepID=A0A8B8GI26_9HEMI|nr:uncharacterized protein LOC112692426 isoform X2 [Sipha flava]